jgi:hypothetical protein
MCFFVRRVIAICATLPVTLAVVDLGELLRILVLALSNSLILTSSCAKLKSCYKLSCRAVRACRVIKTKVLICVVFRIA